MGSRSGHTQGGAGRSRSLVRAAGGAVVAGLALFGAAGSAGALAGQDAPPLVASISVSQTADADQGPCAPAPMALRYATEHTDSTFTLRITTAAPLCEPVEVTAAAYGMPGNGVAWPQQLIEFTTFVLGSAGETEVTFTKTCRPAQFDVLTGAVPQTISPWGEQHGPLLFPYDVDTAYQHWGGDCGPEPTTTTAPTTTTTVTRSSSTVPPSSTTTTTAEVLSVSEERPTDRPPTTMGPEVLGTSEEAGPAALAFTGLGFPRLAVGGAALLLLGVAAELSRRRRAAAGD